MKLLLQNMERDRRKGPFDAALTDSKIAKYKVAFMSGSYLAKVSHVYIYHKVSLMSVYIIAKVRLLYIS